MSLLGFVAALGVFEAERDAPEASITTFGDALWWVLTTITTVGYGDLYPVTAEGRLVAGGLMVAGIAVLGTVTAAIATWFLEQVGARDAVRGGDAGRGAPRPRRGTARRAARRAARSSRRLDVLESAENWSGGRPSRRG